MEKTDRESGDSVIGIITSVTYPQTGNMRKGQIRDRQTDRNTEEAELEGRNEKGT